MRQLLLLRHAEARPSRPELPDQDRPLSARGRTEALDAARCIAGTGLNVDAMLVSPALRTHETALIVAAELDLAVGLRLEPALYPGAAEALWPPLHRVRAQAQTVLMVGHNPGLSELARRCAGGAQSIELRTGGLCRVDFDCESWHGARAEAATSLAVLR